MGIKSVMFFNKKKIDTQFKRNILAEIDRLKPWYQPIDFGYGIKIYATDKNGRKISSNSLDRGIRKWFKFIKPNLPFCLRDRVALDCGCNAGIFLVQFCKESARKSLGIEIDKHYFRQCQFVIETFSKLDGTSYPITVFNSSFENFDYKSLGKIDITFFLNSIYHIGRVTEIDKDENTILDIQCNLLRRISNLSEYILFQANPLRDEGRGKGRHSLHRIVESSGLRIVKEQAYNHPRGLVVLVKK